MTDTDNLAGLVEPSVVMPDGTPLMTTAGVLRAMKAERDSLSARVAELEGLLAKWAHDGSLQTFEHREQFRKEVRAALTPTEAEEREHTAAEMREACANEGYRVCAETRHVKLGDAVRDAIRALPLKNGER